eukprot:3528482-Pyramimonas_sp.AAC.1
MPPPSSAHVPRSAMREPPASWPPTSAHPKPGLSDPRRDPSGRRRTPSARQREGRPAPARDVRAGLREFVPVP